MSTIIDFEAFFKLSYGIYLVTSGNQNQGNGFISNSVFQVTAEPSQFAVCCNKNNYTSSFIEQSKGFAISVLAQSSSPELIGTFGYKSGKDVNKFEGMSIEYGITGVPMVMNDCIAYFECKLMQIVDVGTHWMFIGEVVVARLMDSRAEPLTYAYYRQVRKGFSPPSAPTFIDKSKLGSKPANADSKKYICTACSYIYDENEQEVAFLDLPEDWICPVCGSEKSDFIELTEN